jgi:hypothetical protein
MAQGLIPARGKWILREYNTTSTATYLKGCAVAFSAALGTVSEYSGGAPGFLGIAQSNSTASLPSPKVLIAIPAGPDCTCTVDAGTIGTSLLTVGFSAGLWKVGNYNSLITMSYTSAAGKPFVICTPLNSAASTIECSIKYDAATYGSAASQVQL